MTTQVSLTEKKKEFRRQLRVNAENNDIAYGFFTAVVPSGKLEKFPDGGKGYVCVMLHRPPKGSDSTSYKASFSFCSPLDVPKPPSKHQYVPWGKVADKNPLLNKEFRSKSKRIAMSRMYSQRVKCHLDLELKKESGTKLPDLFRMALEHAKQSARQDRPNQKMVPEWVEIAALEYGLR